MDSLSVTLMLQLVFPLAPLANISFDWTETLCSSVKNHLEQHSISKEGEDFERHSEDKDIHSHTSVLQWLLARPWMEKAVYYYSIQSVPNIWPRKSIFESHLQEKLNSASLGGSNPGPSQERPVFKPGPWPAHEKEALSP